MKPPTSPIGALESPINQTGERSGLLRRGIATVYGSK